MTTLMTSLQLNLKNTTDTVRSALYLDLHLELTVETTLSGLQALKHYSFRQRDATILNRIFNYTPA